MGPLVTNTLVTALTKLSTSQEAVDNRLIEMSKKFGERNTTLTKQLNDLKQIKNNSRREGLCNIEDENQFFREEIAEIEEAIFALLIEDSEDLKRIIHDLNSRMKTKVHIRHDTSHIKIFRRKIQLHFFSRNLLVCKLRINIFKFKTLRIKTHSLRIENFNSNHLLKSLLHILITYLLQSKLRLFVINVATLIT